MNNYEFLKPLQLREKEALERSPNAGGLENKVPAGGGYPDWLTGIGNRLSEQWRKAGESTAGRWDAKPVTGREEGIGAGLSRPQRDPISDRAEILESFPQPKPKPEIPAAPESAEAILDRKESEARPDNTREMTNFQRRYLQAVEAQIAAANQAREQAKWLMLAQIGFGMSSGRPDALSQVGPNAVGNMYGVNRDYTNAQNSIADNYAKMLEMQRLQNNDARSAKYQDANLALARERLQAYKDATLLKNNPQRGIAAAAEIRQKAEAQALREFSELHPKDFGGDPVARAKLWEDYKRKRLGEIIPDLANAYRGSPAESIFTPEFEVDVSQ